MPCTQDRMGQTLYELDVKGDILLSVYNVPDDLP